MGLFDRFFKKPAASQEIVYIPSCEAEAWMAVLYATLTADGDADPSEIDGIITMMIHEPKFSGVNTSAFFQNAMTANRDLGGLGLIQAASSFITEDEDKERLFYLVLKIAMADGEIDDDEVAVIQAITQALKITTAVSDRIVEEYRQELLA